MTPFPWPPKELSPNARKDRRAISGIRARYRDACAWRAKLAKMQPGPLLRLQFHPPDKRKRDLDNMLAQCKALIDGISDGIGQDDSEWGLVIQWGEPVAGGEVRAEILQTNTVPMRGVVT